MEAAVSRKTFLPGYLIAVGFGCGAYAVLALQFKFSWFLGLMLILIAVCAAVLSGDFKLFFITLLAFTLPISFNKYVIRDLSIYFRPVTGIFFTISDFVLFILYCHWVWKLITGEKLADRHRALIAPLIVIASLAVTAFFSQNVTVSFFDVFLAVRAFLIYTYLIYNMESVREVKIALYGFFSFYVVQLLISFLQYVKRTPLNLSFLGEVQSDMTFTQLGTIEIYRPSGILLNSNSAAGFYVFVLPLLVAALFWIKNRYARIAILALTLVGILGLVITFSRAGWMGALIGGIFFFVLSLRRGLTGARELRYAGVIALLALLLVLPMSGKIVERLTKSDPEGSTIRFQLMDSAVSMIANKPVFGFGSNTFAENLYKFDREGRRQKLELPVHNIYLLVAAENGLLGLTALLVFAVFLVRKAVGLSRLKEIFPAVFGIAILSGLAGFAWTELLDASYKVQPLLLSIWFLTALTVVLSYIYSSEPTVASVNDRI